MRKAILALAAAGVAVSALALKSHFAAGSHVPWSCGPVTHSAFAAIGPVPVAAIGVAGYVLLAVLAWFRRRGWTLVAAFCGLGFAAYLSYVEAFVLRTWCALCVISQVLIALIVVLAAVDAGFAIVRRIRGASNAVDAVVNNLRYG